MRKIKFRGQRQSDNKWVYGDLLQPTELCNIYEISDCESIDGSRYDVIKDTIGQYTGLHDKNGKEIYEGDIVKKLIWNELKFEAKGDGQEYCYAKVMYIEELAGFYLVNRDNKILWEVSQDKYNIEVAGNIYDNPELLKGEQS